MGAWVYMLRCADDSFYVGLSRQSELGERLIQHESGGDPKAYTYSRRPVALAWSEWFERVNEAIACERRLKGWSRAKKQALIRGDYGEISQKARRRGGKPLYPSRAASRPPQDEE